MKNIFFQQQDCDIYNQRPFFCLKNENSQKVANPFNFTISIINDF